MKKIVSGILSVALAATFTTPAFAYSFSDIGGSAYTWAADQIEAMYEAGYINGYEDETFRPDNQVTRIECLALFARAMGSKDEANKKVLELAHADYDNLITNYSLKWGEDEIAYLLYKGVLKKADLDTYLLGEEKNEPMKRYEAAIIITKALGGESTQLGETTATLDYTDASEIPSAAVNYVKYASDAGIMNGMDGGRFSPNSSVSRAQIAVMLARTVDKTEYEFFKAQLVSIDEEEMTLVYKKGVEEVTAPYTKTTAMRVLGTKTQDKLMTEGVQCIFALSGETVVSVDALTTVPDVVASGTFKGYSTSAGKTYIRIIVNKEAVSYECSKDLSVTYAGEPATLRSFAEGDTVFITVVDGKAAVVEGAQKEVVLKNAVVEDIIIDEVVKMEISSPDSEYDGKTFEVDANVSVRKNNLSSELSKIYAGDTVDLTLKYGVITKIVASSSTRIIEGTIKSITIESPVSSMKVMVKGEEVEYSIPNDVAISVNGEEGTLYDFRVGDSIKITTESNAITKIVATTTQVTEGGVTGVITGINTSYGFISVENEGQVTQVFCKDSTTTFITSTGSNKKMSSLEVGQTVTVRGTISNGAFMGKLVIIESE